MPLDTTTKPAYSAASASLQDGKFGGSASGVTKKKQLSEIEKLELDNQRMEERLNALKDSLAKQKEKRAASSRESLWRGGEARTGSLGAYAQEVLAKKRQAAKAKRASFSGAGAEADQLRKGLENSLKSHVGTADELRRQGPPPPSQVAPTSPERIQPQPPGGTQPSARPPRLWRVPSSLDHNAPSLATHLSASSPELHTPSSNVSYRASARRVSYAPGFTGPAPQRETNDYVDIPPAVPTDARDQLFNAAEEGRSDDVVVNSSIAPTASASSGSQADSSENRQTGDSTKTTLLDGTFDEAASHKEFVEALEEWRRSRGIESRRPSVAGGSRRPSMTPTSASTPASTADFYSQFTGEKGPSPQPPSPIRRPSMLPDFLQDERAAANARRGSAAAFLMNTLSRENRSASETSVLPVVSDMRVREQVGMQRHRSGSLATLSRSLSSLGTSLGQVLGISVVPGEVGSDPKLSSSDPELHSGSGFGNPDNGIGISEKGKEKGGSQDSGVDMRSSVSSSAASTNTSTDLPLNWSRKAAEELFAAAESNALSRRTSKVAEGLTYMEKLLLSKYRSAMGASADAAAPNKPPGPDTRSKTEADLEMGDTDAAHEEVVDSGGVVGAPQGNASNKDVRPLYGYHDVAGSSGSEPESEGEEATGDNISGGRSSVAGGSQPAQAQRQPSFGTRAPGGDAGGVQHYFDIEDVTGTEEQVLQGALRTGRVLEMVGGERMKVEEPE